MIYNMAVSFFFSSRRRHTSCALVTGVQTCALPISLGPKLRNKAVKGAHLCLRRTAVNALKLTEHAGERVLRLNRPAGDLLDKLAVGHAHRTRHQVDGCRDRRSEEHTSELQSLMRISYAVFCLKKKNIAHQPTQSTNSKNTTQTTPRQNT